MPGMGVRVAWPHSPSYSSTHLAHEPEYINRTLTWTRLYFRKFYRALGLYTALDLPLPD